MDFKYLLIDEHSKCAAYLSKFSKFSKFYCKGLNDKAIPEKFQPDLNLSNLEPFQLSFTYNGGTD